MEIEMGFGNIAKTQGNMSVSTFIFKKIYSRTQHFLMYLLLSENDSGNTSKS